MLLSVSTSVTRRVFDPRLPIAPTLVGREIVLPPGFARAVMAGTVSLLPGTLSAELEGDVLTLHVLDGGRDVTGKLRAAEHAVARIFRAPLDAPAGDRIR